MIKIPGFKDIKIKNIVFDYNGTLAKDGYLKSSTQKLLYEICDKFSVYVITADTFGTVKEQLKDFDLKVKVLDSINHTKEKGDFIEELDSSVSIAIGNGNNDTLMLKNAAISVVIIGDEGCSKEALLSSDIVCKSIDEAMELFLYPKRLVATLRR